MNGIAGGEGRAARLQPQRSGLLRAIGQKEDLSRLRALLLID
jgi:hypothetical protein